MTPGANLPPTPIVALDVPDGGAALSLVDRLGDRCSFYKIGSELFTACGPAIVRDVQGRGAQVFLDLKFHDIPNTVRGAVRSAASLGVRLLTVHASGGTAMLAAAVEGTSGTACELLAVTVLTSLDLAGLGRAWGRDVGDMRAEVLRLARLAAESGVHGVVCSGQEAGAIRDEFAGRLTTLVPGVRLAGADQQDQSRVVTPRQAADAGARYIVLGRAVTAVGDPRQAMERVLADLS